MVAAKKMGTNLVILLGVCYHDDSCKGLLWPTKDIDDADGEVTYYIIHHTRALGNFAFF